MKAKISLLILITLLASCDASLSSEDKKEIVETKELLREIKSSNSDVNTANVVKPVLISEPVYETETDQLFHELHNRFDVIDIRVTPIDGIYKVAFINERQGSMAMKEIPVPLSFFKSVYDAENLYQIDDIKAVAKRGYSAKFAYLLDQGERLGEKKAILELFNKNFT